MYTELKTSLTAMVLQINYLALHSLESWNHLKPNEFIATFLILQAVSLDFMKIFVMPHRRQY